MVRDITRLENEIPPNANDDDESHHNENERHPTIPNYGYDSMKYIWNQWQIYVQQQTIARRECYYIYYEINPVTGQTTQQIFLRGTTLWIDIVTCVLTYMVYDTELQCHVHYGFVQHTNRILNDIIPLLSKDANIELCGHSLGGAVASLLAMKLQVRGCRVTQLTTIGEPAYLWFPSTNDHSNPIHSLWSFYRRTTTGENDTIPISHHPPPPPPKPTPREHVQSLLPKDHIRIEHDCDVVPYLPPFGSHIGNKIWITRCNNHTSHSTVYPNTTNASDTISSLPLTNVYWVDTTSTATTTTTTTTNDDDDDNPINNHYKYWWTESIWIHFCIPEIISYHSASHRVSNYIRQIRIHWNE